MAKRDGYYQVFMKTGVPELKLKKSREERVAYNVAESASSGCGLLPESGMGFCKRWGKETKNPGGNALFF
mgnify:FL=1